MSSPAAAATPSTEVPHPFNQPSADIILRTSDRVDFRVHSQVLAQASHAFADMFALPQPSPVGGHADGGPPVVDVAEDSVTLELLLRVVYPVCKPKLDDPQTMVPALKAAIKYAMEWPLEMLAEKLTATISRDPLQVWAAACRTGLEDVARGAAEALRASGKYHHVDLEALLSLGDLGNMSGISSGDYFRLKRFLSAKQSPWETIPPLSLLSPQADAQPHSQPHISSFSTDIPNTDVVCRATSRTGARVVFHAHQAVLAVHSPVLKARIADGSARADLEDNPAPKVVLDLDESAEVVSSLLAACYSPEGKLPSGLTSLGALLLATRKYDMTRLESWVGIAWETAMARSSLEAYLVAATLGLQERATSAARRVARDSTLHAYVPVMEITPALAYHRLLVGYDSVVTDAQTRFDGACEDIPSQVYVGSSGYSISEFVDILRQIKVHRDGAFRRDIDAAIIGALGALVNEWSKYSSYNYHPQMRNIWPKIIAMIDPLPGEINGAIEKLVVELD